eukprot:6193894-Pleurochrysis_carterae.AAC.2
MLCGACCSSSSSASLTRFTICRRSARRESGRERRGKDKALEDGHAIDFVESTCALLQINSARWQSRFALSTCSCLTLCTWNRALLAALTILAPDL